MSYLDSNKMLHNMDMRKKKKHPNQDSEVMEQVAHKCCAVSVLEGFQDPIRENPEQPGLLFDPRAGFYLGRRFD